jgi:hypothetical protein
MIIARRPTLCVTRPGSFHGALLQLKAPSVSLESTLPTYVANKDTIEARAAVAQRPLDMLALHEIPHEGDAFISVPLENRAGRPAPGRGCRLCESGWGRKHHLQPVYRPFQPD